MYDIIISFKSGTLSITGFLSKEPMPVSAEQAEAVRSRIQEQVESLDHLTIFTRDEHDTELSIPSELRKSMVMLTQVKEVRTEE